MESLCVSDLNIKKQHPQIWLLFLINNASILAEVFTQKNCFTIISCIPLQCKRILSSIIKNKIMCKNKLIALHLLAFERKQNIHSKATHSLMVYL